MRALCFLAVLCLGCVSAKYDEVYNFHSASDALLFQKNFNLELSTTFRIFSCAVPTEEDRRVARLDQSNSYYEVSPLLIKFHLDGKSVFVQKKTRVTEESEKTWKFHMIAGRSLVGVMNVIANRESVSYWIRSEGQAPNGEVCNAFSALVDLFRSVASRSRAVSSVDRWRAGKKFL
jgi:hypothetical protein